MPRLLSVSLLYGFAMFAAGFALGALRELVIVRMLGIPPARAELFELPVMLIFLAFVSRRLIKRRGLAPGDALVGGIGGALLLAALDLFLVGMAMRGLSFREAWASFDPRTGTLFPFALALAAMLPFAAAVIARKPRHP